jgi:hypothetical protein
MGKRTHETRRLNEFCTKLQASSAGGGFGQAVNNIRVATKRMLLCNFLIMSLFNTKMGPGGEKDLSYCNYYKKAILELFTFTP